MNLRDLLPLLALSIGAALPAQGMLITEDPEPNGLSGRPTTMLCGDQVEGSIAPPVGTIVDEDTYSFLVTMPMDVYASTARGSATGFCSDTVLELYASNGTTLLASDDNSGDGLYSHLGPVRLLPGTYHLNVLPRSTDTQPGTYTLDLVCLPPSTPPTQLCGPTLASVPEPAEPNAGPLNALNIACCSAITGTIDSLGDEDWYCLLLNQTTLVSVQPRAGCGTMTDNALRLWDSTGTQIIVKDDVPGNLAMLNERLPPSTYYISVSGGLAAQTGDYCLDVTCALPGSNPTGDPDFGVIGGGCQGSNGRTPMIIPRLGEQPRIGSLFCVDVIDLPPTATAAFAIIGFQDFAIDLTAIGAGGCTLLTSTELVLSVPVVSGEAEFCLRVPARTDLLCDEFNLQFAAIDPTANALGLIFSDRGDGKIGI